MSDGPESVAELEATPAVRPMPVETVTPMKPSEAMLLGRLTVPVGTTSALVIRDPDGTPAMACALGAMAVGFGRGDEMPDEDSLFQHWWPATLDDPLCLSCPSNSRPVFGERPTGCWAEAAPVSHFVLHLNDDHEWGTGRIADWLESLGL